MFESIFPAVELRYNMQIKCFHRDKEDMADMAAIFDLAGLWEERSFVWEGRINKLANFKNSND